MGAAAERGTDCGQVVWERVAWLIPPVSGRVPAADGAEDVLAPAPSSLRPPGRLHGKTQAGGEAGAALLLSASPLRVLADPPGQRSVSPGWSPPRWPMSVFSKPAIWSSPAAVASIRPRTSVKPLRISDRRSIRSSRRALK